MCDAYGRVRGVHALAAGARGSEDVDLEVLRIDLQIDILGLGENRHGRGGGVNATLALGLRDTLDAVYT